MDKLKNRDNRAKECIAFLLVREVEQMRRTANKCAESGLQSVVEDLSEVAAVAEDLVELLTGRRPE